MTAGAATRAVLRQRSGLPVLAWPALDGLGADVLVTTCQGGISAGPYESLNLSLSVGDDLAAVLANRRRVAAALGARLSDFVFARQVHGRQARVVTAADRGRGSQALADAIEDADALVTADPGTVLAVLVGDCVPIVLLDPEARVLAAVHAGWRGTVAGVTAAALAAMAALGARPGSVLAGLGPAIGADRYQVGADVRDGITGCLGADAAGVLRPDGTGRWLLDLHAANRALLVRSGVPEDQIHVAAVPTGPDPGLFFSDRTARPCGRFALVARLTELAADVPVTDGRIG
jgi:YfiH family protein